MIGAVIGRIPATGVGAGGNTAGNTALLSGAGVPTDSVGKDGDFYFNTTFPSISGPKSGSWPAPVPLGGTTVISRRGSTTPFVVQQAGPQVLALPQANPDYVELYYNGVLQPESFFTISQNLILVKDTLGAQPDDTLELEYGQTLPIPATAGGGASQPITTIDPVEEVPAGLINGTNNTFQLSYAPVPKTLNVYIQGNRLNSDQYSLNGTTLSVNLAPDTSIAVTYTYVNVRG